MDLVSVITPTHNLSKFISQTIESALAQTYINFEMIIVDDLSGDNTKDIIRAYTEQDSRIKLIELKMNVGPALARNIAIKEAKGRYIAFLDGDDIWLPEKLEKQIKFMSDNALAFTYSSYYLMDEEGNSIGKFITKKNVSYYSLLKTNSIGCLTAIYDTNKIGKNMMPSILKRQDYGLWLNILKEIKTARGILEPLAVYRLRKESVSSNKLIALKYVWKIYRDVEKLNIFTSIYYLCFYIYNGLRKYK